MRGSRTTGAIAVALCTMMTGASVASAADGTGGLAATPAPAPATPASPAVTTQSAPATVIKVTAAVSLTRSQTKSVQRRVHVRADGRIGTGTRSAIRRYQSKKKLMRTGRPNLQTLRAMKLKFAETIAGRMARKAAAPSPDGTFPIQGPWHYGGAATTFRARGGAHQGVDLFAACGTPLVAASPGQVRTRKYEARAGNYVVITGTPGGEDEVYMHLKSRSPLKVGDAVQAGTPVGTVGDTGDADGCHLHFELWTAPGWYAGGHTHDPTATLDAWAAAAGNPAGAATS
ncbi:M23 family metallopeptidase [Patulibacter minatonensis]|uniref:M23 family metallopeptidase n=1 Tax=Patulibacter minatonensis TaxID=298163 RepID=UPI0012F8F055|nr:peptidoglycan DD-metalloendopeptidase family protein [Patulibacter minatonensis]